jgi:hypothetical protein
MSILPIVSFSSLEKKISTHVVNKARMSGRASQTDEFSVQRLSVGKGNDVLMTQLSFFFLNLAFVFFSYSLFLSTFNFRLQRPRLFPPTLSTVGEREKKDLIIPERISSTTHTHIHKKSVSTPSLSTLF